MRDSFNLEDSYIWNLTIQNRSQPPYFVNVSPYGYPTIFGWTSNVGSGITSINASENTTIVYDHNSLDPEGDPIVYNWTINGVVYGNLKNLSHFWDFDSQGLNNVVLTISDNVSGTLAHKVSFTWNTSILNFNRPPRLNSSLPNVSINGTLTIGNYLTGIGWGEIRFYDPDNDTLTYTYTNPARATITVSGNDVTFTGDTVGNDTVVFTASDGSSSVASNNVTLFITEVEESEEQVTTVTTSSGSSGTSGTTTIPYAVIQEVEKETQVYFEIIVPKPVTIYQNNTVREVVELVNDGDQTLHGIYLTAVTNITDVEATFSTDYFAELAPGDSEKTDLVLTSYKLFNHYEIIIWANVTDPKYQDKAVVYVNSIERTTGNQSVAATKITFARDLISSNPECLELNEYLKRAQDAMNQRDYEQASQILDSVIQGCKYLVSQSRLRDERPLGMIFGFDFSSNPYIMPLLILFILSLLVAIILTIRAKGKNEEEV